MFDLNKVKAHADNKATKLIANVVRELGHMFDVLSVKILENRKRIVALETRIKELENINKQI
jgi:BMFP domain-containing protein YqiC